MMKLLNFLNECQRSILVIKVSISCLVYNQAKYVRECLNSLLAQKTNFEYEILIHDDASTDGTDKIIKEFAEKYPNIVKPIFETENQFQKGIGISREYIFSRVQGKYIAFCEGDDYWTDENKLQKQVDFLEANPDYTVCFHRVKKIYEPKIHEDEVFPSDSAIKNIGEFNLENLLKNNFMHTNSVMFRWAAVENISKDFPDYIMPGDWYFNLFFASKGKIKFLDEVMSVYRVNSNGVWFECYTNRDKLLIKNCDKMMNFRKIVYEKFANKSDSYLLQIFKLYRDIVSALMRNNQYFKALRFCTKNIKIPLSATKVLLPMFFDVL